MCLSIRIIVVSWIVVDNGGENKLMFTSRRSRGQIIFQGNSQSVKKDGMILQK